MTSNQQVQEGGRRRGQTPLSKVYSDEEMDRRIADLASRKGIGRGSMVVRHIEPITKPDKHAEAAAAVLAVLASGKPAAVSFLAQETGLPRSRVSVALRRLATDGRIVAAGRRRQAKGGRQQFWAIVEDGDV